MFTYKRKKGGGLYFKTLKLNYFLCSFMNKFIQEIL